VTKISQTTVLTHLYHI